jgi:hypothetical protein
LCCNVGFHCSKYGCTPDGATDCGGYYCNPGQKCATGNGCLTPEADDCGDGKSCKAGTRCWTASEDVSGISKGEIKCLTDEQRSYYEKLLTETAHPGKHLLGGRDPGQVFAIFGIVALLLFLGGVYVYQNSGLFSASKLPRKTVGPEIEPRSWYDVELGVRLPWWFVLGCVIWAACLGIGLIFHLNKEAIVQQEEAFISQNRERAR